MLQGCLQFVIVVFPDHTRLLFLTISGECGSHKRSAQAVCTACCGDSLCNSDNCYVVLGNIHWVGLIWNSKTLMTLTLCLLGNFSFNCRLLIFFFKIDFFEKTISVLRSECQTDWI